MTEKPPTGIVDAATKTAGKVIDAISSPVLITMMVVFGALIVGIMFLWDRQSSQNRIAFINLVEACVPNNYEKE